MAQVITVHRASNGPLKFSVRASNSSNILWPGISISVSTSLLSLTDYTTAWQPVLPRIWTVSFSMWLATTLQRLRQSSSSMLGAIQTPPGSHKTLMRPSANFAFLSGNLSTAMTSLLNATVSSTAGCGRTLFLSTRCAGLTWMRTASTRKTLSVTSCLFKFGPSPSSQTSGHRRKPTALSNTLRCTAAHSTLASSALLWAILLLSWASPTGLKPGVNRAEDYPIEATTPPAPAAPPTGTAQPELRADHEGAFIRPRSRTIWTT